MPPGIVLVCFLALMLVEYRKRDALAPVSKMCTTFPVVGTLIAMIGDGAFVTSVLSTAQCLFKIDGKAPPDTGLIFWPQVAGALIAAAMLGAVFRTRFLPVLGLFGMLVLIVGGIVLVLLDADHGGTQVLIAFALLGLGAGATVSPGLFMAGLALPAQIIGRIFALIELVRSVADFILAPVMLHIANKTSGGHALIVPGIHLALWVTVVIAVASTFFAVTLFVLGGSGLQRPDLHGWLEHGGRAVHSPKLLQAIRD